MLTLITCTRCRLFVSGGTARKLQNLDTAFNIIRHITDVSSEHFFAAVQEDLANATKKASDTKDFNPYSHAEAGIRGGS